MHVKAWHVVLRPIEFGWKEGKSESGQGDNPPSINKISTCKFFSYKISANIESGTLVDFVSVLEISVERD